MDSKNSLQVSSFPPDLHRALRIKAAEMGTTIRQLVIDTLTATVSKKEPAK